MIRINLMPREERVRRRSMPKIQLPDLGAVVPFVLIAVVGAGIAAVHTLQVRRIAMLETEVATLRREAEGYKPQLERIRDITQKRKEVQNRLDIIAKLDQERYFRVRLLDEASRALPENMWLTKMQEQAGHNFTIEGVTFSNFIVARFMQDLEASAHWQDVELDVVERGRIDGYDVMKFTLACGSQP